MTLPEQAGRRFRGVFVHPLDVQNEGLGPVFDRLQSVGVTAVAFTPNIAWPARSGRGKRFPELHVDGHARVLARPVWGRTELQLEFTRAVRPAPEFYRGLAYPPPASETLGNADPTVPEAMLSEARSRGMRAYLHIAPLMPPGLRELDCPVHACGCPPPRPRVSATGCPSSPDVRAWAVALLRDTAAAFPAADGIFCDWVEFGAYRLWDQFGCFCRHCMGAMTQAGLDADALRAAVAARWNAIATITRRARPGYMGPLWHEAGHLGALSAARSLAAFKAARVGQLFAQFRAALDADGHRRMSLPLRGWAPPWNVVSGLDYAREWPTGTMMAPKIFNFDYSAMPGWWCDEILALSPNLGEQEALALAKSWSDLEDQLPDARRGDYVIPGPRTPHPVGPEVHLRRLARLATEVPQGQELVPFLHAYQPIDAWRRTWSGTSELGLGAWVQMYGYLSDDHLAVIR